MGSTLRIGRLAGIPIGIQPLWLLVVALITYSLGDRYYAVEDASLSAAAAYALGLLSALALFAGIVLHELGHAIVARSRGVEVDEIDLWLLGGVARIHGEPDRPRDELAFALAGPAVTAALLALAGGLLLALGDGTADWVRALVGYGVFVNALILGFNLLPAFPLDGGRVLRAVLWLRLGDRVRATRIAASGGRAFGFALVALGVLSFASGALAGLWMALVGGFLVMASTAEVAQLQAAAAFGDTTAAEVMSAPPVSLDEATPLDEAASAFAEHLLGGFAVVDGDGRALGVLSLEAVRAVARPRRPFVRVGELAARDPELLVDGARRVDALVRAPAFVRVGRAVVVDDDGRPLGVVSMTDVQRRLRVAGV